MPRGSHTEQWTAASADAGTRLDKFLAAPGRLASRGRAAAALAAGKIFLNGKEAGPSDAPRRLATDDIVSVWMDRPGSSKGSPRRRTGDLEIVFEDALMLVVNKPPGLVVHPGSGNWSGTLLNALLRHSPHLAGLPRAGIVHRLDKDTSGLMVVAKTLAAQTDLVRQLQARVVRREYLALAHGRIARKGTIDAPIGRHPVQRTRMAVAARGRHAVTHYEVLERFSNSTLLRCRLETGRTHQIRVHLGSIGHPLVGDPTYGKRHAALAFMRQALHAERLALHHPQTGRAMSWRAPPPADVQRLIRTLRRHDA